MRLKPFLTLITLVMFAAGSYVSAQDPLDEMYGQAVHSYFRGDATHAEELLNEVISAGSQDPRVYFFRGLCQSYSSYASGVPDFEKGAQLEIDGKKVVNVGKSLERIQGVARVEIEKVRSRARLASRARVLELQRTRYEEMQRNGGASGGIFVPPRIKDPAPAPSALAPNDPFNSGMTKGDPTVLPSDSKTVPSDDPLDDAMPIDPAPDAGTTDTDPFGT